MKLIMKYIGVVCLVPRESRHQYKSLVHEDKDAEMRRFILRESTVWSRE